MTKPLVLIVDDVTEYREEKLPELCAKVGADYVKAQDVHEAIQQALRHSTTGARPLSLIILDMHMPIDQSRGHVEKDAGIKVLEHLQLRPLNCPVVVFTAYPSFHNCVQAVKAGATAYIPKLAVGGGPGEISEGGPEDLKRVLRELLFPEARHETRAPSFSERWLTINYQWLVAHFRGKWVAIVPEESARTSGLTDDRVYPARDGLVIVSANSYEAVREIIATTAGLYLEFPPILRVAPEEAYRTDN